MPTLAPEAPKMEQINKPESVDDAQWDQVKQAGEAILSQFEKLQRQQNTIEHLIRKKDKRFESAVAYEIRASERIKALIDQSKADFSSIIASLAETPDELTTILDRVTESVSALEEKTEELKNTELVEATEPDPEPQNLGLETPPVPDQSLDRIKTLKEKQAERVEKSPDKFLMGRIKSFFKRNKTLSKGLVNIGEFMANRTADALFAASLPFTLGIGTGALYQAAKKQIESVAKDFQKSLDVQNEKVDDKLNEDIEKDWNEKKDDLIKLVDNLDTLPGSKSAFLAEWNKLLAFKTTPDRVVANIKITRDYRLDEYKTTFGEEYLPSLATAKNDLPVQQREEYLLQKSVGDLENALKSATKDEKPQIKEKLTQEKHRLETISKRVQQLELAIEIHSLESNFQLTASYNQNETDALRTLSALERKYRLLEKTVDPSKKSQLEADIAQLKTLAKQKLERTATINTQDAEKARFRFDVGHAISASEGRYIDATTVEICKNNPAKIQEVVDQKLEFFYHLHNAEGKKPDYEALTLLFEKIRNFIAAANEDISEELRKSIIMEIDVNLTNFSKTLHEAMANENKSSRYDDFFDEELLERSGITLKDSLDYQKNPSSFYTDIRAMRIAIEKDFPLISKRDYIDLFAKVESLSLSYENADAEERRNIYDQCVSKMSEIYTEVQDGPLAFGGELRNLALRNLSDDNLHDYITEPITFVRDIDETLKDLNIKLDRHLIDAEQNPLHQYYRAIQSLSTLIMEPTCDTYVKKIRLIKEIDSMIDGLKTRMVAVSIKESTQSPYSVIESFSSTKLDNIALMTRGVPFDELKTSPALQDIIDQIDEKRWSADLLEDSNRDDSELFIGEMNALFNEFEHKLISESVEQSMNTAVNCLGKLSNIPSAIIDENRMNLLSYLNTSVLRSGDNLTRQRWTENIRSGFFTFVHTSYVEAYLNSDETGSLTTEHNQALNEAYEELKNLADLLQLPEPPRASGEMIRAKHGENVQLRLDVTALDREYENNPNVLVQHVDEIVAVIKHDKGITVSPELDEIQEMAQHFLAVVNGSILTNGKEIDFSQYAEVSENKTYYPTAEILPRIIAKINESLNAIAPKSESDVSES